MKILLLDVERSPNVAYVWGLFKENIPLARLIDTSQLLCYAAKWYGEEEVLFDSLYESGDKKMLKSLHKLMSEADAIVHYNGTDFDIPVINTEFVRNKMEPPAPYKQIDLLKVVRQQFKFTSNKMDHVSKELGCGAKMEVDFDTWIGCMNNREESWSMMATYNIEDVLILERMYEKLKPWIKNHPNHGLYGDTPEVCPNCGSDHFQKRGLAFTSSASYQRYHCLDCGTWFRNRNREEQGKGAFRGAQ